jgi:rod shape-determining protein MreB
MSNDVSNASEFSTMSNVSKVSAKNSSNSKNTNSILKIIFKIIFGNKLGFREKIAIDLGTANTIIYKAGDGIVLDQPSIVAVKNEMGILIPIAFGDEAKLMLGRTPMNILAIRPLKDGVVADFKVAESMIKHFISLVTSINKVFSMFLKPSILVCVPSTSTPVERRAIQDAVESCGAKECFLIEEPMAAAIGAGLNVTDPSGSMIVDIGGGTTEIAVISLGGIVYGNSLRIGGDKMDSAIVDYMKKTYGLLIGDWTAEKIKKDIGCAMVDETTEGKKMIIKGRSIEGSPTEIIITPYDIQEALSESVSKMVGAIKVALESTPPELSSDVISKGIVLTGGGALLRNLDKVIEKEVRLHVKVSEEPLLCVAKGSGFVMENIERYHLIVFRQE